MEFVDIRCGDVSLKDRLQLYGGNNSYDYSDLAEEASVAVKNLLIPDYSCDEAGYISKL